MNSSLSQCKEVIRQRALALGAVACGFAKADVVDAEAIDLYDKWIGAGCNGTMEYCSRYCEQRNDPRTLLEGVNTVISCAFSYYQDGADWPMARRIAKYAWGNDYHWVLKKRLGDLAAFIQQEFGGETRVCVDTAPMRERYWAQRSGIGFVGVNNQLIVPRHGSYVVLGEVLWTGEVDADAPCTSSCQGCMACVKACPGRALDGAGRCDARRCISYLTIEHNNRKEGFSDIQPLDKYHSKGYIYGCDVCQSVCPHNRDIPATEIEDFVPNPAIMSLSLHDFMNMTSSHYRKITRCSAMNRITLSHLQSNISDSDLL